MTVRWGAHGAPAAALLAGLAAAQVSAQDSTERLRRAVDRLGDFDYAVRMEASRTVRRADPSLAGAVLLHAVREHDDSYVQFRALVLLHGLNVPAARGAFEEALGSPNDRLRAAAYGYFEHAPDPRLAQRLLAALGHETSEFVRPALVRALAAHDGDEAVRTRLARDVDRGEGHFRSAVIEALGDHGAEYAVDALIAIASQRGSLQDDALLALGKIGDRRAASAVVAAQGVVSDAEQPIVAATACLLGLDCADQMRYLNDALRYGAQVADGGGRELLRNAASGLAALAMQGSRAALDALFETGRSAAAPARAPVALALGTVALRRPAVVREALAGQAAPDDALLLLRDAFDMLDEDLAEERFYTQVRRAYWDAAEGSAARALAEAAIRVLEF